MTTCLGNSFYVIDRFPSADHPTISDLDFATSWNMPSNTVQVAGRPGCFEGSRSAVVAGSAQSRIQVCCKGFTGVDTVTKRYNLTKSYNPIDTVDDYKPKQVKFRNNASNPMFTDISICDGTENFRAIASETYQTAGDVTTWTRVYANGDIEKVVYNPTKTTFTTDGIASDAYMSIIHSNATSTDAVRLFDYGSVSAPTYTITYGTGGQCDLQK